jgi:phage tail protein X
MAMVSLRGPRDPARSSSRPKTLRARGKFTRSTQIHACPRRCNGAAPIDEVGYLSYDSRYADLLFEVVTHRYEARMPIVLTTNKGFAEWADVFPHAACVVTLVDRLTHRAEVLSLEGKSYRLKESEELAESRKKRRRSAHKDHA